MNSIPPQVIGVSRSFHFNRNLWQTDNLSASCGSYGVTSWQDSRSIAIISAYANGNTTYNLLCVEQ